MLKFSVISIKASEKVSVLIRNLKLIPENLQAKQVICKCNKYKLGYLGVWGCSEPLEQSYVPQPRHYPRAIWSLFYQFLAHVIWTLKFM